MEHQNQNPSQNDVNVRTVETNPNGHKRPQGPDESPLPFATPASSDERFVDMLFKGAANNSAVVRPFPVYEEAAIYHPASVNTMLVDLEAGKSWTERVWSGELSARYVIESLRRPTVRKEFVDFATSKALIACFNEVLGSSIHRVANIALTRSQWYNALRKRVSAETAGLLMECLIPVMKAFGLIAGDASVSYQLSRPLKPCTWAEASEEFAVSHCASSIHKRVRALAQQAQSDAPKRASFGVEKGSM